MPSSLIRKSIWGVIAVAIIAGLTVAALPMIASTRIVRDRVAMEMSAWSGYRVDLANAPEIKVWPSFRAILHDVSLSDWDDPGHRPVLDAESVELELSPIAALGGNVVISTAKLVRPMLYVSETAPNRYAPVARRLAACGTPSMARAPCSPKIPPRRTCPSSPTIPSARSNSATARSWIWLAAQSQQDLPVRSTGAS